MSSMNKRSWSERIDDGIPLNDTNWWESRNNYLALIREMGQSRNPRKESMVGERTVNTDIDISQISYGFQKGSGEKKTYYRRRKIPKRKKKKYPTKPRMSETEKWRKGEQLSMNREKYEGILS